MYKSPQSNIESLTEIVISIGLETEYDSCNPLIFIAPVCTMTFPDDSKGHMSRFLSGSFSTSPKTIVPKKSDATTGNKNTTKAALRTAISKLRTLIPLYLFSNDKIVQYNYVA
jgi:hypothetical protein